MKCQRDRGAAERLCEGELRFQHMLSRQIIDKDVAVYKCALCAEFQHKDASKKPGIGTGWQHIKKGTTYTVLAVGQNTEDAEPLVVYQGREDGRTWIRPLVMWFTPGRFRAL